MSDPNDWTAAVPESLLKATGLKDRHVYQAVQLSAAILEAVRVRREKIRLAKPGDSEAERQEDAKIDQQIFGGAMVLIAARTKRKMSQH